MLFQTLLPQQKIDFFCHCQSLLVAHHSDSHFIFRKDNVDERLYSFKQFTQKYKGFVYSSENLCVLYNKINLKDPRNPAQAVRDNMYKEPSEDYNCYIVDFAAFDKLESVGEFIGRQDVSKVKHVLWAKNNEIKVYETGKLLSSLERLKNLPKIVMN